MVKIAPSILSADFSCLGDEIRKVEQAGADWIHIDVMDGHFVPNLTFGAPVVAKIRPVTKLFFDCHLMVENPASLVDDFVCAGADMLVVHIETDKHMHRLVQNIKSKTALSGKGMQVGISLNPATPLVTLEEIIVDVDMVLLMSVNPGFSNQRFIPATIDKIRRLKKLIAKTGSKAQIQVDGGINTDTAKSVIDAGADILVAGSAVYGADDIKAAITALRC